MGLIEPNPQPYRVPIIIKNLAPDLSLEGPRIWINNYSYLTRCGGGLYVDGRIATKYYFVDILAMKIRIDMKCSKKYYIETSLYFAFSFKGVVHNFRSTASHHFMKKMKKFK